jgi:hypothetical protein
VETILDYVVDTVQKTVSASFLHNTSQDSLSPTAHSPTPSNVRQLISRRFILIVLVTSETTRICIGLYLWLWIKETTHLFFVT